MKAWVIVLRSRKAAPMIASMNPMPTPTMAVMIGRPGADHRAEGNEQDDDRHGNTDDLRSAGLREFAGADDLPTDFDTEGVGVGGFSEVDQILNGGRIDFIAGLVVLDRGVGDGAVLRDLLGGIEWRGDANHFGKGGGLVRICSIAAWLLGSVMPADDWKTIVAESPAAEGKLSLRRSSAFCDSVPGMEKASTKVPPNAPARPPRRTSRATQPPTTLRGLLEANLAHRVSGPLEEVDESAATATPCTRATKRRHISPATLDILNGHLVECNCT